jgi:2-polyprenyl-3-methyl-5-hydroxy-6-metoxy-1,4-benzoquinol methylase
MPIQKPQAGDGMVEITAPTPARTSGYLEDRLSGLTELLQFAPGSTVLDVGTNRGLVALEFGRRGALVHGCDLYQEGIYIAREIFKEVSAPARFEVVDLSKGPSALEAAFGPDYRTRYDIVLFLGVYQHLIKQMPIQQLEELIVHLANRTGRFFAFRTQRLAEVEGILNRADLTKVHFSRINKDCGPCGIWERMD